MDKYFSIASDLLEESNMINNGFSVALDLPSKNDLSLSNVRNDSKAISNSHGLDNENDDYMENLIKGLDDFLPFGEGEAVVSSKKYQEMVDNGCNIISKKYREDTDMYTITYEITLQRDEEKTQEDGAKLQLRNTNGFRF